MRLSSTGSIFAIFLGMLAALPPLSIDMALPALVSITSALHTTPDMAGLTLSLFMLGFGVSPIVYGPLADRFGRRPVLLAGLVLFALGGVAATLATSIALLLGARLVQGAGAGVGMTLAFAIVRDLFEGRAAQSRLALITVVANIAPILAPTLGTGLLVLLGWRGIYGLTAVSGLALMALVGLSFNETLTVRAEKKPMLPELLSAYRQIVTHREVVSHLLVNGLGFGWMFAYVAGSPLVLIDAKHVAPIAYAMLFACTGAGIVAGATLNGLLAKRGVTSESVLLLAILLAVFATLALVGITALGWTPLPVLMPLLVLATASFGLAAPSASHGALGPIPELAGIAGGLLTSVQMLFGAVASWAVAFFFPEHGALAMTGTMAAMAVIALLVYLLYVFQRARLQSNNLGAIYDRAG
jgi:DHA1 family bicyclomycin/chloramphenicol resistance-like MFS transporter